MVSIGLGPSGDACESTEFPDIDLTFSKFSCHSLILNRNPLTDLGT